MQLYGANYIALVIIQFIGISHQHFLSYSPDFTKALISFEKGINDKESLDKIYQVYMDNDSMGLLNDEFDYLIVES